MSDFVELAEIKAVLKTTLLGTDFHLSQEVERSIALTATTHNPSAFVFKCWSLKPQVAASTFTPAFKTSVLFSSAERQDERCV